MPALEQKQSGLFSGSTLKLIACIAMFVDHFGLVVFPQKMIFRMIGRLAFPLFAYFIAEGCKYTRNKLKHFLLIFSVGIIYFFFYLVAYDQVYPSIFLTFSFSILNVYLIDALKQYAFLKNANVENKNVNKTVFQKENSREGLPRVNKTRVLVSVIIALAALAVSYIPFAFVTFDYGYIGMLAPVLMSLFDFSKISVSDKIKKLDCKASRLAVLAVICVALAIRNPALKTEFFGYRFTIQVCNLFSLPLLALYNGKVGTKKLKYFFYAFYPLHLGVIMAIKTIIDVLSA